MNDPILAGLADVLVALERQGERRLPPERTLTDTLNVPRGTLRERLAALETLGVIRSTQGSGTYLAEPGVAPDASFVRLYFELALRLRRVTVEQIEAVRELLERETARLAATARTAGDLDALREAFRALVEAKTFAAGDEADYAFHMTLARAAHNPVLLLILDGLSSALRHVLHVRRAHVRRVPGGEDVTDATHRPLLEAIEAGDPTLAVTAMVAHFSIWNEQSARAAELVRKRKKAR